MVVNNVNVFLFSGIFKGVIVGISHRKAYNVLRSLLSFVVSNY